MRMLLDTNRYRDYSEGIPEVLDRMRRCEKVYLSCIILAGLRAGFLASTRVEKVLRMETAFEFD